MSTVPTPRPLSPAHGSAKLTSANAPPSAVRPVAASSAFGSAAIEARVALILSDVVTGTTGDTAGIAAATSAPERPATGRAPGAGGPGGVGPDAGSGP